MFDLILKILLAHLIGDFVLQTNHSVKQIREKKFKSKYLYLHFITHFLLIFIITGFKTQYILPALLLSIAHIIIDIIIKFFIENQKNKTACFFIDQILHLISITIFIKYFYSFEIDWDKILNTQNYLLLLIIIVQTFVSSIIIKVVMQNLSDKISKIPGNDNAGKYIGMLERLFIFGFIIINFWEGIGFLLAAKSIFRFGDLKENKDVKLTEYILIGTLLSFGLAILVSVIYLKLG